MEFKWGKEVIDLKKGVEIYDGDEEFYFNYIPTFETTCLDPMGKTIFNAIIEKNWQEAWHEALGLKESSLINLEFFSSL